MDDRVEALVVRLHLPCALCPNAPGPGQLCARGLSIRAAIRAGIELAAEVAETGGVYWVGHIKKSWWDTFQAAGAIRALLKEKP